MIGRTVNNYEIQSLIGEGGMGAVYLARHPVIGRNAAIKVLHKELAPSSSLVTRFVNEARAVNALRHPNLIDIIDAGVMDDGTPYLMMEYLEGDSLAARLARLARIPVADALEIIAQVAEALEEVHQKQIIHRDLKPDNLFIVADAKYPRGFKVKILDFGIAKLMGEQVRSPKTQTGMVMGTPAYMSPEQCKGLSAVIDRRSDVYALGVILFHMVCGKVPFDSEGPGEILAMHLYQPVPSPLSLAPALSAGLVALILKALEKDPQKRWQSMAEMRSAVAELQRNCSSEATADTLTMATGPTLQQPAIGGAQARSAPATPNTTLSASPAVQTDPVSGSGARLRRRALLVGGATALIAAGIGTLVAVRDKRPPPTVPEVPVVSTPAPKVATVVPEAGRPQVVATPAVADVEIEVVSAPPGARVLEDGKGGRVLGTTPFTARFKQSDALMRLWFERAGFKPRAESISVRENRSVTVVLEKLKPKTSPRVDPDESRKI